MEREEIEQYLSKMDKKIDKILKLTTTIAKALHLVPVSEKEEREIQLLQRKNASIIQKVQEEIAALEEVPEDKNSLLNFFDLYSATESEIYGDIIGDDYIPGGK